MKEVEIRGPLQLDSLEQLRTKLREEGSLLYEGEDIAIFYKDDLRLKKGVSGEKLQLKLDSNTATARREIEVYLQEGEFSNAKALLEAIGYHSTDYSPMYRIDYE